MYGFLSEDLLNAFLLLSDLAGHLIVDFDVTIRGKIDGGVRVVGVIRTQSMSCFQICVLDLRIYLLPRIILLVELILRARLDCWNGGLLVLTLLEEILIHINWVILIF